jgi:hypothetical protein
LSLRAAGHGKKRRYPVPVQRERRRRTWSHNGGNATWIKSEANEEIAKLKNCHPREGGGPGGIEKYWIPAFAGMTIQIFCNCLR